MDYIKDELEFVFICIAIFWSIIIPIVVGVNIYHKQTIEFEKYKIEMQVNNGDIPKEEGE